MVDDRPEHTGGMPDPDRPRRPPPTIDLEATTVSEHTPETGEQVQAERAEADAAASGAESTVADAEAAEPAAPRPISPWVIGPFSGAVAATLVIGVGWLLGWPAVQTPPVAQPTINTATLDELSARVAGLEVKTNRPTTPVADPAAAARLDALEKSVTTLRSEVATSRAQSEKLAGVLGAARVGQHDATAAPSPDMSGIDQRIAKIESAVETQRAEIAQQGSGIAEAKAATAKPADDTLLRRVVAAALLDLAVRHGDAYTGPLAAARSLADDGDQLKPLEAFAASGVPNPFVLSRELLEIVPKLAPPASEAPATGAGIIDRLQAGAAKLVRIQRTDAGGTDRSSVVARVTAAALRNDVKEARRQLKTLSPEDRGPAQAWLDKIDARDAALAASRKFADGAMAALGKGGQ